MKVYDDREAGADRDAAATERRVGIAEYAVTTDGAALVTSGLGSCIGVALMDEVAGVAGLAHVMLPAAEGDASNRAKFADTGITALIEAMEDENADRGDMTAKIAGGSDMLDFAENGDSIGARNAAAVRETLSCFDIPIACADLGGDHGRSLRLEPGSWTLVVTSANREADAL